jgi:N-methylhydantoinase B
MVAAVIETDAEDRIVKARVAVGACSPVARRLTGLEDRLIGRPLGGDLAGLCRAQDLDVLSPLDDVRATAGYRVGAAQALVGDLLSGLSGHAGRRAA